MDPQHRLNGSGNVDDSNLRVDLPPLSPPPPLQLDDANLPPPPPYEAVAKKQQDKE